jgi:DNA-binding transcriptional regulator YiaG
MQILSIMKDGRWKNDAMPAYYARKIKVSQNAVAKWHSRKSSPDP